MQKVAKKIETPYRVVQFANENFVALSSQRFGHTWAPPSFP